MGKQDKDTKIKVLTQKDTNTLKALANVHCINKQHLREDLGQTNKRIAALQSDGYIKKNNYYDSKERTTKSYYNLTSRGQDVMRSKLQTQYFYSSNSPSHDLKLADTYFSLDEDCRNNWITEDEQRTWSHDRDTMSPCDGGYRTSAGTIVVIEVTTSSYKQDTILQKQTFAAEHGCEYTSCKA